MTQDDLNAYADQAARELQLSIDFQVLKELVLKVGGISVWARAGVYYRDVEQWCALTGIRMPVAYGQEYVFAQHEDATAFVLRFG